MRVFISSTVYDLIDIRSELAEQLRSMSITPVLSDDKLSDFRVQHDVNSIETCLLNVESCDEVLLVLDKRYGPTLENCGYDKVSATHLEYRHAIEKKIPIHVYVRDRLEADFTIWRRNKKSNSVALSWISQKDIGLFELLDEHAKLHAKSTTSNWYFTFSNSIDLKASISKYFEKRILPERLAQAIQSNIFPLFDIKVETTPFGNNLNFQFRVNISNISRVPAFNFHVYWEEEGVKVEKDAIFSPGQSVLMTFLWSVNAFKSVERFLIAEYESLIGISVRDRFSISGRINNGSYIFGGRLVDRKFRRSSSISLEIEDT
jgi:hypothetical protein